MEELDMLAKKYKEVSAAVVEIRRMSPIRAIREMIFEYEDGKRIQMSRDAYVWDEGHEQGYKEAETKYQEQIRQEQERNRQLEEEVRRLRGE
jgi:hypothetical protein